MRARSITFGVALWRLLTWVWSLLIIGAVAGFIGNTAYTYATTSTINFADPRTLSVTSWLSMHLLPVLLVFCGLLVLTLYAYLADHSQSQALQKQQQAHNDALVEVARGVVEVGKGVQTALGELKVHSMSTPSPPSTWVPAAPESAPVGSVWNVPYRRNPFFTGREQVLQELHEHLTEHKSSALTQPQAITGLGGIGKTQIAVEYAYRYGEEYRFVLWVNAASRDALMASFIELAQLLKLAERGAGPE